MEDNKGALIIYQTEDNQTQIDVVLSDETVWLNRNQMSLLFDRDVKTIGKHISNALQEELRGFSVVAKFATTASDGKTYQVEYYNLDLILSVGYRVKSSNGIVFRRWANSVLKDYLVRGYALNKRRLAELGEVVDVLKRSSAFLDTTQAVAIMESFSKGLTLLDDYDHMRVSKPEGTTPKYILTYEDCRKVIDSMGFGAESDLFGHEKDGSFKGVVGNVYQTFGGEELYPSTEEKAANLLYFIVKDHSFSDGNKRIAAAVFLYFLSRNGLLYDEKGQKVIDDKTLAAMTIMIAESRMDEREMMTTLVMNFICK